jgi:hypothetical protein
MTYSITIFDSQTLVKLDPSSQAYLEAYAKLSKKQTRPDHPLPEFDSYLSHLKPFGRQGYKPMTKNGITYLYTESNERGDYLRPPWHLGKVPTKCYLVDDFGNLFYF